MRTVFASLVACVVMMTTARGQGPAHGRLFPPEDLGILESPDRDEWQQPDRIMDALLIADGSTVADIGAGGGWFTIRLARRVGPNGRRVRRRRATADARLDQPARERSTTGQRAHDARDVGRPSSPDGTPCRFDGRHLPAVARAGRLPAQDRSGTRALRTTRDRGFQDGRHGRSGAATRGATGHPRWFGATRQKQGCAW